jgi:hypothetical protein
MKPLARWTIGKTNELGEETLRHSIKRFKILYPEFDLIICCNNLTDSQRLKLNYLNVKIHDQQPFELDYPLVPVDAPPGWKYSMPGWGWKLVPPRLRIRSHELWIDNDLIILERLPSIEQWLSSEKRSIISDGLQRAYGIFDEDIPSNINFCAGFFGLPPNYDFSENIKKLCKKLKGEPLGYYDEQGITVLSVIQNDPIIASEIEIIKKITKLHYKGMHFIGVNRTKNHEAWKDYKCYF